MDIYENEVYNIRQVLKEMSDTLQGILGEMKRPVNPVIKALQLIVLVVGAMGIMNAIEKIVGWIKGGF